MQGVVSSQGGNQGLAFNKKLCPLQAPLVRTGRAIYTNIAQLNSQAQPKKWFQQAAYAKSVAAVASDNKVQPSLVVDRK